MDLVAFLWGRAVSVDLYHLNRQMLCWKPNRNFFFFLKKRPSGIFLPEIHNFVVPHSFSDRGKHE